MMVGKFDKLATPSDALYAKEVLKKGVKFYKEYDLGHLAFFTAKDVSYITDDMASLLKTYHDATTPIKKR